MFATNIEIFLQKVNLEKKKKTEKVNKFANNIEIFLKKKKTKRIIMIENNTEVLLKISKIKKL